jgi:hypothetical protein
LGGERKRARGREKHVTAFWLYGEGEGGWIEGGGEEGDKKH